MPRWRQDRTTGKLIPIDEEAMRRDGVVSLHTRFEPFTSPIDGTYVDSARKLREHNKRHGVVHTREFGEQHFEQKKKERNKFYTGEHSRQEKLRRKQEIYETMMRAERDG